MDQNENKNYNLENDPGQTQPGSAGAENQQGTQDVYGQPGAQGAYGQPDVAANSSRTPSRERMLTASRETVMDRKAQVSLMDRRMQASLTVRTTVRQKMRTARGM